MSLTITDLFCGAGGSGLGAHAAGYRLVMAANHWAKAIETHAANFPDTEHDCADISQVDPRRYPATDVLWASPECTNHSQAKGRKRADHGTPDMFGDTLPDEAAERSRATMWDVPRFTEAMLLRGRPYRAVVVENVVEAAKWIPFRAWLAAMESLGYDHQVVSLNSMHAAAIDDACRDGEREYQRGRKRISRARTSQADGIDEIAVERAASGDTDVDLTSAEKLLVIERMLTRGVAHSVIARCVRLSYTRVAEIAQGAGVAA